MRLCCRQTGSFHIIQHTCTFHCPDRTTLSNIHVRFTVQIVQVYPTYMYILLSRSSKLIRHTCTFNCQERIQHYPTYMYISLSRSYKIIQHRCACYHQVLTTLSSIHVHLLNTLFYRRYITMYHKQQCIINSNTQYITGDNDSEKFQALCTQPGRVLYNRRYDTISL